MKVRAILVPALLLCLSVAARADEIRLKDGSKIVGTIVGYEDGSFKVETAYGYALVRKDKIAAIIPSGPGTQTVTVKKSEKASPSPAHKAEEVTTKAAEKPAPPAKAPAAVAQPEKTAAAPTPAHVAATAKPLKTPAHDSASETGPVAPQAPPPIREEVAGNLYTNHTYGFTLYKPPSWHLLEGARQALPTAVVAMGTSDESTLMIIAREKMSGTLEKQADLTERRLREIYENYRRVSQSATQVAGLPALERHYRGWAQEHDWSGVLLTFAREGYLYTVLGMTYSDSDLIQIQQNVIARTVDSFKFDQP